jgi:hypothetical protein
MKTNILAKGLKPPVRHPPRRLKSTEDLRVLQRLMTHALVRPLTPGQRTQRKWIDGRATAKVAAEFLKPNARLTSFERLEIYNRMYWFRLIGGVTADNPGLGGLLGEKKFDRLVQAYLARYPSRSFTLRNLCSRLPGCIRAEPKWTAPHSALAHDIARFEWAQTVAFDGEKRPVVEPEAIAGRAPGRIRLGTQPYLSLLELNFPVDEYVTAIKKRDALRAEASNTVDASQKVGRRGNKVAIPGPEKIYLAVHRLDGRLYYKRLEAPALRILKALGAGKPLPAAVGAGGKSVKPEQVKQWFTTWMKLGWLCQALPRGGSRGSGRAGRPSLPPSASTLD